MKWQLRFNEEKCEAMRITHSRDKSTTNYKLGTALKDVKSFKDLGIIAFDVRRTLRNLWGSCGRWDTCACQA